MRYINDTCIFLEKMNGAENFFDIVSHLGRGNEILCVTDIVLEEVKPGTFVEEEDSKRAKEMYNSINAYKKNGNIEFIEVNKIPKYKKNYDDIRQRYYGHLTDIIELRKLVKSGQYTKEEVKNLKYKDRGECSCLAVAMENPEYYIIVSQDNGLITLKPNTNIFKIFEKNHKIKIYKYETWLEHIKYNKRKKYKVRGR